MSEHKPTPPNFVPEEDLSLHENFAPIIAENGLIRQPEVPQPEEIVTAHLTRIDALQDLVQLRQAQRAEQKKQQAAQPPDTANLPTSPAQPNGEKGGKVNNKKPRKKSPASESGTTLPGEEEAVQTATYLPTVRQAKTTALVPVSKLTLARRIRLMKRKRQHKLRLARRAQKQAVQAVVSPQGPAPQAAQVSKRSHRWGWVLVVLLLLFIGSISSLVPVERIPFLRQLAYAMGFTKDDVAQMSFLRALLTWTDKTVGLPGNWSEDFLNTSLLARKGHTNTTAEEENYLAGLNARMNRANGKTSLINMAQLQQLQREQGRPLDAVHGAVMPTAGQEQAQADPAQLRDDRVIVRTESTIVQGDVYFGSDPGTVSRNTQDGFDSSKTLTKIKNPYISDGKPIDWLSDMAQKMIRTTDSLAGIDRELSSTRVNWKGEVMDTGDQKGQRDLYHAWITSRMAGYTSNNMLKKALADSSFLGASIPNTATNVLSYGGVQVDSDSFAQDQKEWKEYLEFERKCKEVLDTAGARIEQATRNFNNRVGDTSQWDFPANCVEAYPANEHPYSGSKFSKRIDEIYQSCEKMDEDYQELENKCYLNVSRIPGQTCAPTIATTYESHWNTFLATCTQQFNTKFQKWYDDWWQKNCPYAPTDCANPSVKNTYLSSNKNTLEGTYQKGNWQKDGQDYTEQQFVSGLKSTLTVYREDNLPSGAGMRQVVIDQNGGSSPYFPHDGEGIEQTVKQQMTENKTL